MNRLYYGDNLPVMRENLKDESVDLVYLDPPFNSKRDYNLLFKATSGHTSEAQIEAFEDTWHWNEQAEHEYEELLHQSNTNVAEMMKALRGFLGQNDMMAYLTMMANRLLELHRILKPTGSLYLHCDPTASHYLKIVLDGVFGKESFLNEIVWKRTSAHSSAKRYGPVHDIIFYYAKSDKFTWNQQYANYDRNYLDTAFINKDDDNRNWKSTDLTGNGIRRGDSGKEWRGIDVTSKSRHWAVPHDAIPGMDLSAEDVLGRLEKLDEAGYIHWPAKKGGMPRLKQYADEMPGLALQSVWIDIPPIGAQSAERLGYPTQKPLTLLERIISASSDEGAVVLDPFCGCGTAVHAAQKLKRKWIGIDITHLAISLIEKRLKDAFPRLQFEIHGTPKDLDSAKDLARRDKYQFQWWAVSLVDARPFQGRKKGADTGIDGIKFFRDIDGKDAKKIVVSVKGGGNLKADDVRSIMAVRERENADIALFISLEEPSRGMIKDAASAGFYESANGKKYPRLQLLTIDGLLRKHQRAEHPDYEPNLNFAKATTEASGKQETLL
jgi:DNA modification methylase